ncbi:MAG TPA: glycosyltransferase [Hanamia sp.]|nr:glycosyltransferase [Hanamia sp.]
MFINKFFRSVKSSFTNIEFRLLERRANRYGYNLVTQKQLSDTEEVIENYFGTMYTKNALLSYIIYPFKCEIQNNHSNHRECFTIAQILDELGFKVDVINWNNTTFLPNKKYDLVIDNHNNLARLKDHFKQDTRKIFHATNTHWLYQNSVEYARYNEFFSKTGIAILPPRMMVPGDSAVYCDVISMFGNDFTKSTYGKYGNKVHNLPMSVTVEAEIIKERNYALARKKFVWLNSHGALLKGLDIVIDAFSKMPFLELHICGNVERDSPFINAMSRQLSAAPNITIEGWVDSNSEKFKKLATECAWVINASFSEGGGGSTLNCMAKGLIPVISKSSSITLPAKTGFYFENNDTAAVVELLKTIIELRDDELKEMSLNAVDFIATHHTLENFKSKYKDFLIEVTSLVNR